MTITASRRIPSQEMVSLLKERFRIRAAIRAADIALAIGSEYAANKGSLFTEQLSLRRQRRGKMQRDLERIERQLSELGIEGDHSAEEERAL